LVKKNGKVGKNALLKADKGASERKLARAPAEEKNQKEPALDHRKMCGGVAQMVERMLSMHEAQGSIPCSSTVFFVLFFFCRTFLASPYGPMDKAPAYGAGDSGFESQYGLMFFGGEKKRGDARIELATSCTLSKNHTTRPITHLERECKKG
jgi:hypothetical protein